MYCVDFLFVLCILSNSVTSDYSTVVILLLYAAGYQTRFVWIRLHCFRFESSASLPHWPRSVTLLGFM